MVAYLQYDNFLLYSGLLLRGRLGISLPFCHALSLEALGCLERAKQLLAMVRQLLLQHVFIALSFRHLVVKICGKGGVMVQDMKSRIRLDFFSLACPPKNFENLGKDDSMIY